MNRAHKIKLYPTKSQEVLLMKSCGVARFAYNWALSKWQEDYSNGIKRRGNDLLKELTKIKYEQFPWMLEVSKTCPHHAIASLDSAYKALWKGTSNQPKFKKKGSTDSFVAIENKQEFGQRNKRIKLQRIGWARCAEDVRFDGTPVKVTVKRVADMWFAIVNVEIVPSLPTDLDPSKNIGVDLGVKSMMILSDGVKIENPQSMRRGLKSLNRSRRSFFRKKECSNNRHKQNIRVARKHYRISCIRSNAIHQATSYIVKNYDRIVIETLKPKNMVKNHNLALSVIDVSFGEITRQLAYKSALYGKELIKADQWFPSSKLCSCCGNKKEVLKLSERTYKCDNCGLVIDRDLNAAINLANYSPTGKVSGCEAFGEGSSSVAVQVSLSMNEELTNKLKL